MAYGVFRTMMVLVEGTTELQPVTDLMTWRSTMREAQQVVKEWEKADPDNEYFARKL